MKNQEDILTKKINSIKDKVSKNMSDLERVSHVSMLMAYALSIVFFVVMSLVNFATGKVELMNAALIFTILSIFNLYLCLPHMNHPKTAKKLFQVELIAMGAFFIISGSADGFSIMWLLLTPTVGMFIFGRKETTILCFVNLVMLAFFFFTDFGQSLLKFEYLDSLKWRFPAALIVFWVISFFLESIRNSMAKELEYARADLEKRNALLQKTFGRFLPDEVVSNLLATDDGFELFGKKTYLTVLTSDIRGFSAISGRMEAMDLVNMLNHYLGEMTDIIQEFNGTVIEFMGDGILAIFGAPKENRQHASDAVSAAVKMQIKMEEIRSWNEKNGYPDIEIGIGIHSGIAVVGTIGSEKHLKYDSIGETINIGSRIESFSTGGQTLVSQETLKHIVKPLKVLKTISATPKGMSEPIYIHSVAGIGDIIDQNHIDDSVLTRELYSPITLEFYRIMDKLCDPKKLRAIIMEEGRKGLVISYDGELEVYDNIRISFGELSLLGKVVEHESAKRYTIRYTYVPPEFHGFSSVY